MEQQQAPVGKLTLGYWNTRGRAQPLRYLMAYLGIEWEQKEYSFTEKQKWFEEDKPNMGMDYPNLPFIIDEDFKLSESNAILNYLPLRANRPELLGKTIRDRATVQQLLGLLADFRVPVRGLMFDKNYEENKQAQLENPTKQLAIFNQILGKNKFLVGDSVTIADFNFYEFLHIYRYWANDKVESDFKNVIRWVQDFEALPEIEKHHKSESYKQNYPYLFPKEIAAVDTSGYVIEYNKKFL